MRKILESYQDVIKAFADGEVVHANLSLFDPEDGEFDGDIWPADSPPNGFEWCMYNFWTEPKEPEKETLMLDTYRKLVASYNFGRTLYFRDTGGNVSVWSSKDGIPSVPEFMAFDFWIELPD